MDGSKKHTRESHKNRYESTGKKLGGGTYGTVSLMYDTECGREPVACKKFTDDKQPNDGVSITIIREIRILQLLGDHPNIVRLRDVFLTPKDTGGLFPDIYMVMDYIPFSLRGLMNDKKVSLSEDHIRDIIFQLFTGLKYLDKSGVLHRDLKPENILIDANGVVKIADFGLSRIVNSNRKYSNDRMSLVYRPPELILGESKYDICGDMWSAGCIMGELFSKNPIFHGNSEAAVLRRIMELCGSLDSDYFQKYVNKMSSLLEGSNKKYENRIASKFSSLCSSDAVDLLRKVLEPEPSKRLKPSEALEHPFFKGSRANIACLLSNDKQLPNQG